MLPAEVDGEDVPRVERLVVRGFEVEWLHLRFYLGSTLHLDNCKTLDKIKRTQKAKVLDVIDILPEGRIEFMGVESTVRYHRIITITCQSQLPVAMQSYIRTLDIRKCQ